MCTCNLYFDLAALKQRAEELERLNEQLLSEINTLNDQEAAGEDEALKAKAADLRKKADDLKAKYDEAKRIAEEDAARIAAKKAKRHAKKAPAGDDAQP